MKKIGLLYGEAGEVATALLERIHGRDIPGVVAEPLRIDQVTNRIMREDSGDFAVIIDALSPQVPFYRLLLQQAALAGTAVINNPFLAATDATYFPGLLAARLGIPVPRTALLPSRELPMGTTSETFRNLAYPLDWEGIFTYVGFPAVLKPAGEPGGVAYQVREPEEFFARQGETGSRVMLLQEDIPYQSYFRGYGIGEQVHILPYDPREPPAGRYRASFPLPDALRDTLTAYTRRLKRMLGYEIYRVEFALRDEVPYLVGGGNLFDEVSGQIGPQPFRWLVDTLADYTLTRVMTWGPETDQLSWGGYVEGAVRRRDFARWR